MRNRFFNVFQIPLKHNETWSSLLHILFLYVVVNLQCFSLSVQKCGAFKCGGAMSSKKILGLNPVSGRVCVGSLWVLWLPPTVQIHAVGRVRLMDDFKLQIRVNDCLFLIVSPAIDWPGCTPPLPRWQLV